MNSHLWLEIKLISLPAAFLTTGHNVNKSHHLQIYYLLLALYLQTYKKLCTNSLQYHWLGTIKQTTCKYITYTTVNLNNDNTNMMYVQSKIM